MPNQPRPDNRAHTVRIEDELWERVRLAADYCGTSASSVVRDALIDFLPKINPPPD